AGARRAVFRFEDAERHRPRHRRAGARDAAIGRRHERRAGLLQAVRLRHHAVGRRDQEDSLDRDSGLGIRDSVRDTTMDTSMLAFLAAPFVASLILTGIHAYLGVHVVERGVIFVDLSLAQIAALGATVALL